MRKRVGIARALAQEPEMLLFDEPTAGLDPTNARLVAELIAQLRDGVCDTAIVVTHDLEFDPDRRRPDGHPDRGPLRGARPARRGAGLRQPGCAGLPGRRGESEDMSDEGSQRGRTLRVGVFVLIGAGGVLGDDLRCSAPELGCSSRDTRSRAEFTEVGGLVEGATVRLAGVQIGRVSGVLLPPQPGGKVRVELTIGSVRATVCARIRWPGSRPRACSGTRSSRSAWAPRRRRQSSPTR